MTPKPLAYATEHYAVAATQRTRPDANPPQTVAEFMRAMFLALDEGPYAVRGGVVR